jgi:Putative collagen-binding domain of a collagenase
MAIFLRHRTESFFSWAGKLGVGIVQDLATVNMSKVSGKNAVCWSFDPRNRHAYRLDEALPTSGVRTFKPPSSGAEMDWVLVLDDESQGFAPPGTNPNGRNK